MRYFFVEKPPAPNSTATLAGSDVKHIRQVLRLKPGDAISLFDGQGTAYDAVIKQFDADGVSVTVLQAYPLKAESPVELTVLQSMLKNRKMDTLVRQVTEMGATRWIPFFSQRSVPRPDRSQQRRRLQRWDRISLEAAKQSRRGRVLDIRLPLNFADALTDVAACDDKILFWEKERRPLALDRNAAPRSERRKVALMLGPEGGLSDCEVAAARDAGFQTAALGPRVLRAETATMASISLVQYLVGDLG